MERRRRRYLQPVMVCAIVIALSSAAVWSVANVSPVCTFRCGVGMACLVVASPLRNPFLRSRVVASPLWVGAQRSASVLFVLLAVGLGYVCHHASEARRKRGRAWAGGQCVHAPYGWVCYVRGLVRAVACARAWCARKGRCSLAVCPKAEDYRMFGQATCN